MTDGRHDERSLPPAAAAAWRAYRAMLASKSAHFAYLESLEEKYQSGGRRTLAEQARLANLLDEHDACVAAFTAAMKQLTVEAPAARDALIVLLKDVAAGDATTTH